MDPSPFYDRDLDANAEEFIVGSAKELSRDANLSLVIQVDRPADLESRVVADAVHVHFQRKAQKARREMRELFRRGRASLAMGVPLLALAIAVGEFAETMAGVPLSGIMRESIVIGGWVAMWKPMEIFLYDWWPIRDERRLAERLARMEVQVVSGS